MVRRYFGTDGIRGRANRVITPELALKVGQAAGLIFRKGDHRHRVLIGKDTRLSGYMIETALVAGFTSVGMDVLLTGPIPTPAVAMDAEFGPSMIYITNQDKPGFIGKFSSTLGDAGINIATFHVGREAPGGNAIALIEVDGEVPADVLAKVQALPQVQQAKPLKF